MRKTKLELRLVAVETKVRLMSEKLDTLSEQLEKMKKENVIEYPIKDSTEFTTSTIETTSGDTTEKT